MKKLANLKGAKALNKKEQIEINGGGFLFPPSYDDCICIFMGPGGFLVLTSAGRDGTCPDGSPPDCGFGGIWCSQNLIIKLLLQQ